MLWIPLLIISFQDGGAEYYQTWVVLCNHSLFNRLNSGSIGF
ncbi:hypothetical protein BMEGG_04675 [Priestia megaterium]